VPHGASPRREIGRPRAANLFQVHEGRTMNENLELLAFVLIGESRHFTRTLKQETLRHFSRHWRAIINRLGKGGPL